MRLKKFYVTLLITVFILGFGLRLVNFNLLPPQGETLDEYAWVMVGESLLKEGVPKSWTYFNYPNTTQQNIIGHTLSVAKPALDHPPLFSLYAGLAQYVFNTSEGFLPLHKLRFSMVVLGFINLVLFYFVSRIYLNLQFSLLITAFYATSPSVVLASRLIIAENMLITLLLLTVVVLNYSFFDKYRNWLVLTISFLSVLIKVTGIFLPLAVVMYKVFSNKFSYKKVLFPIAGLCLGILAFFIYGFVYDLGQFINVQLQQSVNRNTGLANFFITNFFRPEVVNTVFLDGSFMLAFICFLVLVFSIKNKKYKLLTTIGLTYLFLMLLVSGESTGVFNNTVIGGSLYGWYKYPLFPVYFLSLGVVFKHIYKNKNTMGLLLMWVFLLAQLRLVLFSFFNYDANFILPKGIVLTSYFIGLILSLYSKFSYKYAFIIVLLVFILLNTISMVVLTTNFYYADALYLTGYN